MRIKDEALVLPMLDGVIMDIGIQYFQSWWITVTPVFTTENTPVLDAHPL